jgi:2-methylcitrate dehydratase PrpD
MVTLDLGKEFMGIKTSLKKFPCCHGQAPALEATLHLVDKYDIKSGDVERVDLGLSPVDFVLLGGPLEKKQNPANNIETQHSLCWGVASAIVYGKVEIHNFTWEALRDSKVQEIARKVYTRLEIELAGPIHCPCKVEIRTKDGMVYKMRSDGTTLGNPENPMSLSDIENKFRECCEHSARPISEKNQNIVIDMIAGLEEVSDVGKIAQVLA